MGCDGLRYFDGTIDLDLSCMNCAVNRILRDGLDEAPKVSATTERFQPAGRVVAWPSVILANATTDQPLARALGAWYRKQKGW
jgi:hypothetical protein